MNRKLKIGAIALGILLVILIALPFLINVNSFRPKIETELTSALGRQVTVGNLSLSILSSSVVADNIAIADDPAFGKSPFITAKSLKVGVELMPLVFSKQLNVTELKLEQPQRFVHPVFFNIERKWTGRLVKIDQSLRCTRKWRQCALVEAWHLSHSRKSRISRRPHFIFMFV